MEAEDEVDDELSEAADTEVIKQFALILLRYNCARLCFDGA